MADSDDSILNDVKQALGLPNEYTAFDLDVTLHINSVFSTLSQLGVGPQSGYMIADDNSKWSDFIADLSLLNMVKSYMYLRVRLLFDPPATGFTTDSFDKQIKELEWRMNIVVDTLTDV